MEGANPLAPPTFLGEKTVRQVHKKEVGQEKNSLSPLAGIPPFRQLPTTCHLRKQMVVFPVLILLQ